MCTLTLFVRESWVYDLMQARALKTLNPNNATGKMRIKCNFNSLHTESEREKLRRSKEKWIASKERTDKKCKAGIK